MNIDNESRFIREKTVLVAYTIYAAAVITAAFVYDWANWQAPLVLVTVLTCIVMYARKTRSYFFRAFCTTLSAWTTVSIEIANTEGFLGDLSVASAVIVLLAVYCLPELNYIHTVIFTCHVGYHLLIAQDIEPDLATIVRVGAVYAIILLLKFMLTKHVETNEQLRENYETIQRAEQTKDDFLANISHEIRTPVNTVCGISEIILRNDMPDEMREEIYDIQTAGRNLLSIVTDILDFTELNSGKSELVSVTYNLSSTINDILNMTVSNIYDRKLELVVDCDPNIPCGLAGDEEKLRRAVMNMLYNAVKFTREGGIILSIGFRREEYGGNLIFTIKDTGIGMSQQSVENLFTSYAQVDTKRNRQEGGLGLGMFITKTIVNRMGGFITVKSKLDKGTEIQLIFPQKIVDDEPIVKVKNAENFHILLYIDMEKFQYAEIRKGHAECIRHLAEGLRVNLTSCHSLNEVKRRLEKETFTHVFISWEEYSLDKNFFDMLAEKMNVVLVLERSHKESVSGQHLLCIYKPYYALPVASILNGQFTRTSIGFHTSTATRFTAPTAKVMVVDDNLMNLKVTEGLLRPYRVKVQLAGSGSEALKRIDSIKPDLIFMDHMMPDMDGVETFHHIRERAGLYYQNVPIIALTANAVAGAREMFINEGFADYITKPVELSSLERVLRAYIPESKILKVNENEIPVEEAQSVGDNSLVLEGIDTKLGLSYCSSNLEDYIDIIRVYYDIGISRIDEIKRHFENKDLENYTILVHAVKSTSLNIGAVKLSGMAERLESAGKRKRTEDIEKGTGAMLAEYERVLDVIRSSPMIFPEVRPEGAPKEQLVEISREKLGEMVRELAQALDSFETEKVNDCLTQLSGMSFEGKALSEEFAEIKSKTASFDFIGAAEELASLIKAGEDK